MVLRIWRPSDQTYECWKVPSDRVIEWEDFSEQIPLWYLGHRKFTFNGGSLSMPDDWLPWWQDDMIIEVDLSGV